MRRTKELRRSEDEGGGPRVSGGLGGPRVSGGLGEPRALEVRGFQGVWGGRGLSLGAPRALGFYETRTPSASSLANFLSSVASLAIEFPELRPSLSSESATPLGVNGIIVRNVCYMVQ